MKNSSAGRLSITFGSRRFFKSLATLSIVAWVLFVFHRFYSVDPFRQKLAYIAVFTALLVFWALLATGTRLTSALFYLWLSVVTGMAVATAWVHTQAIVAVAGLILTALTLGRAVVRRMGMPLRPRLTGFMHALAVGLALCSLGILGIGLLHALKAPVLWGLMSLVVLWGARSWRPAEMIECGRDIARSARHLDVTGWTAVFAITLFFGIFLVRSLAPPLLSDDLTYHLALPRIFAEAGKVFRVDYYTHFNAPLGAEMLYTAGIVLGSEYAVSGLVNMAYAGLLVGAFVVVGRRAGGGIVVGLWGWLALFSVFFYTIVTASGSGDLKFLLYVLLAIDSFLEWCETRSYKALVLCAVETGFSLHFRYHGVILFAGLAAGVTWVARPRLEMRQLVRTLTGFCVVAAVAGCPWLLRNWIETGNPIFPTSTHFFNGYRGDQEMSELWREYGDPSSPWLFGSYGFGTGWYNYFSLPWRLTFLAGGFEGYELTPIFLAFSPLVLWFSRRHGLVRSLMILAGFYATAWFFQMHQLKFLIPAFALWALAVAAGVFAWTRESGRLVRALFGALLLASVTCTLSVFLVYGRADLRDKMTVAWRPSERDAYLTKHLGTYPMMQFINKNLSAKSVVFAIDEQSLFYLHRPYIIGWNNNQLVVDYRTMPAFADLLARLRELQVTHLLFRPEQPLGPNVLVGAPHAALVLLLRSLDYSCLNEMHRQGGLVLYALNYPPGLPAYDATKHADRIAMGDVLMEYGMLSRARDQYAKAGEAGTQKRTAVDSMSHQSKGEFYLDKARAFRQSMFLKPALDEFAAAMAEAHSDQPRAVAARGLEQVRETAQQISGHIWGRLPATKWLISHDGLP